MKRYFLISPKAAKQELLHSKYRGDIICLMEIKAMKTIKQSFIFDFLK